MILFSITSITKLPQFSFALPEPECDIHESNIKVNEYPESSTKEIKQVTEPHVPNHKILDATSE